MEFLSLRSCRREGCSTWVFCKGLHYSVIPHVTEIIDEARSPKFAPLAERSLWTEIRSYSHVCLPEPTLDSYNINFSNKDMTRRTREHFTNTNSQVHGHRK